jgi:hypothetical protein
MAICRRGFPAEDPAPAADRRDHRAVVLAEVDPKSVPQCLEPRKPLRRVRHDPAGPRSEAPVSGSRRTRRTGPVGSGGTGGSPSRNNKVILVCEWSNYSAHFVHAKWHGFRTHVRVWLGWPKDHCRSAATLKPTSVLRVAK